jgi:hypothetical protein
MFCLVLPWARLESTPRMTPPIHAVYQPGDLRLEIASPRD